jgi:hypothetical protein
VETHALGGLRAPHHANMLCDDAGFKAEVHHVSDGVGSMAKIKNFG